MHPNDIMLRKVLYHRDFIAGVVEYYLVHEMPDKEDATPTRANQILFTCWVRNSFVVEAFTFIGHFENYSSPSKMDLCVHSFVVTLPVAVNNRICQSLAQHKCYVFPLNLGVFDHKINELINHSINLDDLTCYGYGFYLTIRFPDPVSSLYIAHQHLAKNRTQIVLRR